MGRYDTCILIDDILDIG